MKKYSLIFTCIFTISCAVPNEIELHKLDVDLSCLSPKDQMYISMSFDRCPLFSKAPTPKAHYWELFRVGEVRGKDDLSLNSLVENTKDCSIGAESLQQYILTNDAKLFVDSMVTRTDSVAHNRLLIYGRTNHNGREFKWIFVTNINPESNLKEKVSSNFNICKV